MSKNIKVKQRDITDCGAACLASIATHYDLKIPVSRIRQMASTDKKGTNVLGMVEGAEKLGFTAKGVKGVQASLMKIPKPAIAHIIVKEVLHHYMVIYKVTTKYVEVMDPADGQLHKYALEKFMKLWTGVLVILLPDKSFMARNEKVPVIQRFWYLIRPHKRLMLQVLFGAIVYTIIGLSTSIFVQKIVDHVFVEGNGNLLNMMGTVMMILLVLQVFTGAFKNVFTIKTGQIIDAQLILGYYKHLLKLPQQFFDTMRVGEIISRINDAVKIRAFINDVTVNIIVSIFIVIFSFLLMFTYYWKLALVVLLIIPLFSIIYFITNKLNKKVERKVMENAAELESQLIESLNSVGTIKKFGIEEYANVKTESRFMNLLGSVYQSGLNNIFSGSSSEFISRLFTILLLWVGGRFVLQNELTPGELLSFYALIGYFTGPLGSLIGMNKTIQNALIAADRLFEIMDLERENDESQIILEKEMTGDILFKDVCFRYGTRVTVFEKLNLTVSSGKVTAIVGESGSGKSTLVSLLQNIYPLQSGSISIGVHDIKNVSYNSLRNIVSIVPQKIDLFAGNIIENIALGDYSPNMKKIVEICSQLGNMEFIEELPNGFQTYLGENGATLSGGQKQRIAIARALYKDPEILVLDEATSSLDSSAERYVQSAIRLLKEKNKTIILIAHRLTTVYEADKIVVLDKGRVVEEGTHQDLLENKSQYYQLWKMQFPMHNGLEQTVE